MSFYGRFEQLVTWILTLFIAVIIAIALFRLVVTIFQLLVFGALRTNMAGQKRGGDGFVIN